jgi:hypothetical protein
MGALTFCAKYPFKLSSMHSSPLILDPFYRGSPLNWFVFYMAYPLGLELDGEYVIISFGTSESSGHTVRVRISELLAGMEMINRC